jgi:hypothetical protein
MPRGAFLRPRPKVVSPFWDGQFSIAGLILFKMEATEWPECRRAARPSDRSLRATA